MNAKIRLFYDIPLQKRKINAQKERKIDRMWVGNENKIVFILHCAQLSLSLHPETL